MGGRNLVGSDELKLGSASRRHWNVFFSEGVSAQEVTTCDRFTLRSVAAYVPARCMRRDYRERNILISLTTPVEYMLRFGISALA